MNQNPDNECWDKNGNTPQRQRRNTPLDPPERTGSPDPQRRRNTPLDPPEKVGAPDPTKPPRPQYHYTDAL